MTKNKEREKKIKREIEIVEEQELEILMSAKRRYDEGELELERDWLEAVNIYNSTKYHHVQKFCQCNKVGGETCETLQKQAEIKLKEARKDYKNKLARLKKKRTRAIAHFVAPMEWVRTKRIELKDYKNSKKENKNDR